MPAIHNSLRTQREHERNDMELEIDDITIEPDFETELEQTLALVEEEELPEDEIQARADIADREISLHEGARRGLGEVCLQWDMSEDEKIQVMTAFQTFIVDPTWTHNIWAADGENRYLWGGISDDRWKPLAQIARRFMYCPASEAPTERTNGRIKKILGTYSQSMSRDIILHRVHIEQTQNLATLLEVRG